MDVMLPMLWQSALLPLGVALAALAAGRALRLQSASLVAVAAGFLASYFAALSGQWSAVPKVALDWLPLTVAVAAIAAFLLERSANGVVRVVARLAVSLAAAFLVVWPAVGSFGLAKAAVAVAVAGVLVTTAWTLLAQAHRATATQPLLLAIVAGGAGLALMLDSSQSAGRLSGALGMALAACTLFALPRLRVPFTPAAAGLAVVVLGALLANAHLYAGFPPGYVALLAGALLADPLVAAVSRMRRSERTGASWATAAVLTVLPVAATVTLAVRAASESGGY